MIDRRFLDVSLVVEGIANSPADNPVNGTQYIVGDSPTGAFEDASPNSIARYDGSNWTFLTPKAGKLEVLNADTGEFLQFDGTDWVAVLRVTVKPVTAIIATADEAPENAAEGYKFLNTSDAKIYTATAEDTFDEGTATINGSRYASSTDKKIYVSDGSELTAQTLLDGAIFLNKADGCLYVYDKDNDQFIKATSDFKPYTETHTLTEDEATAKSFELTHNIAAGQETNILLFVSGVAQAAGVDFTASGKNISWTNKGLEAIGMVKGDFFIIHYLRG